MPGRGTLNTFLEEIASSSPAPGGGSVAALAGALGAALAAMVCRLTIGKKKYADVEAEMQRLLDEAEKLRSVFTGLIARDSEAFTKVMEALSLPKETEPQKALRSAAVTEATKEAALVPLEVMKHCIDALAITQQVANRGNLSASSDMGVSAIMLNASCESAALNVRINLESLRDPEFVSWKTEEVESILRTSREMLEETHEIIRSRKNPG